MLHQSLQSASPPSSVNSKPKTAPPPEPLQSGIEFLRMYPDPPIYGLKAKLSSPKYFASNPKVVPSAAWPQDDQLVWRIERLSERMEDQRAAMPPLVAQGVAAMGWLVSSPPPLDPELEAFMDKLEAAIGRRLLNQCADRSISAIMAAYQASMQESDAAQLAATRPNSSCAGEQSPEDEDERAELIARRRQRRSSSLIPVKLNLLFSKFVGAQPSSP